MKYPTKSFGDLQNCYNWCWTYSRPLLISSCNSRISPWLYFTLWWYLFVVWFVPSNVLTCNIVMQCIAAVTAASGDDQRDDPLGVTHTRWRHWPKRLPPRETIRQRALESQEGKYFLIYHRYCQRCTEIVPDTLAVCKEAKHLFLYFLTFNIVPTNKKLTSCSQV